jgi:D-arabinose 1-dehydrogenase-like Zn-dependent alcohol dehydrogenase
MIAVVLDRFGPPEVLVTRQLPIPTPHGRQVLVRVAACGVCRRDVLTRHGSTAGNVALPLILGHEIAGEVAALGAEAVGLAVGDRVCSTQRASVCGRCSLCRTGHETLCRDLRFLGHDVSGGYAEYVLVTDDNLVRLPDNIDARTGAILACTVGTTYNAVCDTGSVRPGEQVLVIGGGGLGVHAIQVARAAGGQVTAATRSAPKIQVLREMGAHEVVVAADGRFSAGVRKLLPSGADVAIDTVGGIVFDETRRSMAPRGRIVLVGEVTGTIVHLDLATLYRRGLDLRSAVSTSRRQLERAIQLVTAGVVRPLVHEVLPFRDAAAAHQLIEEGHVVGRVVLSP